MGEAMRRCHIYIEPAVVGPRTWNQRKIPGQLADIANRADHGVPSIRTIIIKGDPHVDRGTPERLRGRDEVRAGTDDILELRAGLVHDHRVNSQARDDCEVLARHTVNGELDQINVQGVFAERDLQRVKLRQWDLQVAGQQVSGAHRHYSHWDPRL